MNTFDKLKTNRLLLRRFLPSDWTGLHAYLSDPDVVVYEPYDVFTEEQSKEEAINRATNNAFWAVCLEDTQELIGNVYLAEEEQGNWTIGYVFNKTYQGHGYATEAAETLIDFIVQYKEAHRIYAMCNPKNIASWRLLERLGFRKEGHLKQNVYFKYDSAGNPLWADTYIYATLSTEWRKKTSI